MKKAVYNKTSNGYEVVEVLATFTSESDAVFYAEYKNRERKEMKTEDIKVTKWKHGRPTAIDWCGERWVYEEINRKWNGKPKQNKPNEKDDKK